VTRVELEREFLPWDLRRASRRHQFVRDFCDRLIQAFGYPSIRAMFRAGWLFGSEGTPLRLSLGGGGVFNEAGERVALGYEGGRIGSSDGQRTIGFAIDGVVLDEAGRAMATLEMAPGLGLPDSFVPKALTYSNPSGSAERMPEDASIEAPDPVGAWSDESLPLQISPRPP
jgi:hypothetical protein